MATYNDPNEYGADNGEEDDDYLPARRGEGQPATGDDEIQVEARTDDLPARREQAEPPMRSDGEVDGLPDRDRDGIPDRYDPNPDRANPALGSGPEPEDDWDDDVPREVVVEGGPVEDDDDEWDERRQTARDAEYREVDENDRRAAEKDRADIGDLFEDDEDDMGQEERREMRDEAEPEEAGMVVYEEDDDGTAVDSPDAVDDGPSLGERLRGAASRAGEAARRAGGAARDAATGETARSAAGAVATGAGAAAAGTVSGAKRAGSAYMEYSDSMAARMDAQEGTEGGMMGGDPMGGGGMMGGPERDGPSYRGGMGFGGPTAERTEAGAAYDPGIGPRRQDDMAEFRAEEAGGGRAPRPTAEPVRGETMGVGMGFGTGGAEELGVGTGLAVTGAEPPAAAQGDFVTFGGMGGGMGMGATDEELTGRTAPSGANDFGVGGLAVGGPARTGRVVGGRGDADVVGGSRGMMDFGVGGSLSLGGGLGGADATVGGRGDEDVTGRSRGSERDDFGVGLGGWF